MLSSQPMAGQQNPFSLSIDDYLAFERTAENRHEYIDGEIYLMAGASREHNLMVANLLRILGNGLFDKPCHLYPSDMKVYIESVQKFTYPDVIITCAQEDFFDHKKDVLLNPLCIIEVLSSSTEAYDRGKKFFYYQQLVSFREYLLVAQDSYHIEHFCRQTDGSWHYRSYYHFDDVIELDNIGCKLTVEDIYHKLSFESTD